MARTAEVIPAQLGEHNEKNILFLRHVTGLTCNLIRASLAASLQQTSKFMTAFFPRAHQKSMAYRKTVRGLR
jgi:hypothetical protein